MSWSTGSALSQLSHVVYAHNPMSQYKRHLHFPPTPPFQTRRKSLSTAPAPPLLYLCFGSSWASPVSDLVSLGSAGTSTRRLARLLSLSLIQEGSVLSMEVLFGKTASLHVFKHQNSNVRPMCELVYRNQTRGLCLIVMTNNYSKTTGLITSSMLYLFERTLAFFTTPVVFVLVCRFSFLYSAGGDTVKGHVLARLGIWHGFFWLQDLQLLWQIMFNVNQLPGVPII